IIDGKIDVVLFTNATQVEHVMTVAGQEGMARDLRQALSKAAVASVGPTCSEALRRYGLPVDIEPDRPMMGALVARAAEEASPIIIRRNVKLTTGEGGVGGLPKVAEELKNSLFLKA